MLARQKPPDMLTVAYCEANDKMIGQYKFAMLTLADVTALAGGWLC